MDQVSTKQNYTVWCSAFFYYIPHLATVSQKGAKIYDTVVYVMT